MTELWVDKNTIVRIVNREFKKFKDGDVVHTETKRVAEVFCNIPSGGRKWEKMCAWYKEDSKLKCMTFACLADRCGMCNVRLFVKYKLAHLL